MPCEIPGLLSDSTYELRCDGVENSLHRRCPPHRLSNCDSITLQPLGWYGWARCMCARIITCINVRWISKIYIRRSSTYTYACDTWQLRCVQRKGGFWLHITQLIYISLYHSKIMFHISLCSDAHIPKIHSAAATIVRCVFCSRTRNAEKMLLLFIVVFRCCHVGNIFPFATCPSSRYTHRTGEMIREISKHFWIGIEAWRSRRSCRLWLWSYTPVTYFCRCRRRFGHLAHAQCGWASHPLRNRKKNNNRHKERKRDTHIYIYIYMFLMIRSTITYNDVEDMFIRAQNGNHILQDATK